MSWRTRLASALLKGQGSELMQTMITQIGPGTSTPTKGTAELIAAFRTSPILRMVVSKIAFNFAATPWRVYRVGKPNGRARRSRAVQDAGYVQRKRLMRELSDQGQLQEIEDHPLIELLGRANPWMTWLNARKLTQTYLEIKGEAFWILERNGIGAPVEFWPVPPTWITRTPTEEDPSFEMTLRGQRSDLPAEDVIWFRDLDPANPFGRGIGLGESLGDELETDEYASKMLKTFFQNRGKPDMLVAVKGAKVEELRRAKQKFEEQHRGFSRAFRSFWHSGDVTVHELQSSFNEMELAKLRTWERDIVVNVFGVPPEILGILANSNRATVTEARRIFASEVLIPRLEFMRAEMQAKLVPMFDDRILLDYESPEPDDEEMQLQYMQAAPWAADRGEWRRRMKLPDRGSADRWHYVPIALIPEPSPAPEQLAAAPTRAEPSPVSKDVPGSPIDEEMAESVLAALKPDRIGKEIRPVWSDQLVKWGQAVLDDLSVDPTGFDLINPLVSRHIAHVSGERVADITDTIRNDLRSALLEGVKAGEGSDELAKRVRDVFDVSRARATMIARTEVVGSSNFGTFEAQRLSGVVERREWVATADDRTRDEHRALDGKIVALDEEFTVGSARAMYPGGFGVAEMDINCRCTTVAVIKEPKSAEGRAHFWKVYERERRPWELMALAAYKRGMSLQEDDVLEALDEAISSRAA